MCCLSLLQEQAGCSGARSKRTDSSVNQSHMLLVSEGATLLARHSSHISNDSRRHKKVSDAKIFSS